MLDDTRDPELNVIDLIMGDHRFVEELFTQLQEAGSTEEQLRRGQEIIQELSVHAAVEEQVLYPRVRQLTGDEGLVDHAIAEHAELKAVLADLDGLTPADEEFASGFLRAQQLVSDHVREEEGDLLPRLRANAPVEELERMGKAVVGAKKVAPTRPHPHAPSEPPGNIMVGPVLALVDRVRDALRSEPDRPDT